jgi:DNA recombination protein RmuC
MDLATTLSLLLVLAVGLAVGLLVGVLWSRGRGVTQEAAGIRAVERSAIESRAAEAAVVRESLDRLHDQIRDMAEHRVSWQSQLKQQVEDVRHTTDTLRRETASLSTALRRPQVRGRWGELHLRRVVELAGLVDRCDFTEQVSTRSDDRLLRPDLVVHLAGGKQVVVDSKVPLDAFLDACAAEADDGSGSDEQRAALLQRHARQLRRHVDSLAAKGYWRALPATPEFVVLFVPGESFLSAALEAEPSLIEYAADRQVVLATPTTLIALLRTVAYAWTQQTLADRAREVHALGRDLHERLATMSGHFDRLGRSLSGAVSSYNRAVGSLENRVLVSARRFSELGVGTGELSKPEPVVDGPRPLTAAELLDAVAEAREELPGLAGPERYGPAREAGPDREPPVRRVAT